MNGKELSVSLLLSLRHSMRPAKRSPRELNLLVSMTFSSSLFRTSDGISGYSYSDVSFYVSTFSTRVRT